ncbi:MAG: alpha/beta hydrolase [Vulcanimicrobiaceae bacterium]
MIDWDVDCDRYGSPGGRLVIALHGAVANRKTWLPLSRGVPPDVELWCPDLPGHGARRHEPFTMERALALVDALLAAAAPRRAIVAGDSLGGYLALAMGARRDPRVAGVVAGGCTWSMTGWRGALARASDVPPRLIERLVGSARTLDVAAAILPRVTDAQTARAVLAGGLRTAAREESLRELRGVDVVALARAIDVPLAIVNGSFDWPTRAQERDVLRANPHATLTLGRIGHGVGFLLPAAFARAILQALRADV